jgi:tripartite-type tricarboxylate transporter receptor subunit TctC
MEGIGFQGVADRLLALLREDGVMCLPLATLAAQIRAQGEQGIPMTDVLARSIESFIKAEKLCPVPTIIPNQAGGSGTIGMTSVAQSRGNVHMLMTSSPGR